jgi:methyl-accepting chemotaxis protein
VCGRVGETEAVSQPIAEISDVEARLRIFGITAETRKILQDTWPIIQPRMPAAIDDYLEHCRAMSWVSEKLLPHRDAVVKYYLSHFEIIFQGWFDERYAASFRRKRAMDLEIGFHDSRPHMSFGHYALRAAIDVISRRQRFSAPAAAKRITALSQALAFDNATTLAVIVDRLTHSTEARRNSLDNAIESFDVTVNGVLRAVKEASTSLVSASDSMRSVAESTEKCMAEVSQAALRTTQSVSLTAAATEAIGGQIDEIRQQAVLGTQRAGNAAEDAKRANGSIRALAQAVGQIGSVAEVISAIAAQTNLLALNAAIEAARAGESGKGFAVVAAEVKALANQTSRATEEIVRQISEIQALTQNTVGVIDSAAARITDLTQVASEIAAAVNEQSEATQEIGRGMQLASEHTASAARTIATAEQAVNEGAVAAAEVLKWSETLSSRADELGESVKAFFLSVRTA